MFGIRMVVVVTPTGVSIPHPIPEGFTVIILPVAGSKTIQRITKHPHHIWNVSGVVTGILLFALFIHNPWPGRLISLAALTGSALLLGYSIRNESFWQSFGLAPLSRKILIYAIPALIAGMGLAWLTRRSFDLSPLPESVSRFAFIAPLIGATEELIFRGYIQGYLRPIGRGFSVVYASTVHTCYKLLVILSLSLPLQFDLFFLVIWTFIGGLVFGVLREGARSSIPPVIAHAIFDIVLYGGYALAPVWVWS